MPTLSEITLTKDQEKLLIPLCEDVATAPTELKLLVRLQKHVKLIWEAGYEKRRTDEALDHIMEEQL